MATGGGDDSSRKKGIIPTSFSALSFNKRERRLRSSISDDDDSTMLKHVIDKVRKHPGFKDESENVIKDAAQNFIEFTYFQDLFSQFNETQFVSSAAKVGHEADAELMSGSEEAEVAAERSAARLKDICNLQIKLCLSKLDTWSTTVTAKFASLIEAQYGATHAALLIGNDKDGYLSFEWNSTSLVDPQFCERADTVFLARIPSDVNLVYHELEDKMQVASRQLDYGEQTDILFEATVAKAKLINQLIELVVKYNSYYYYHSFSRNCHHFVSDALKALEVKNPHNFTGRLREYFEKLKKGLPKQPPSFRTHSALDAHVRANMGGASHHDLEFYLCVYFHFHHVSRSQSENPRDWRCGEETCEMANVERRISQSNLVLNQFT